ncbi:hypothetical protein G6F62_006669 [Rhizopus arrhizus]|nr:hypothetical protein G6F62_006669 [Rhizopus arrhizus]
MDNVLILLTFDETATYSIRNKVWSLLMGAVPDDLKGTTDSTFYSRNLGQQDTNKKMANVFKFVADQIGYENVNVPASQIPMSNSEF